MLSMITLPIPRKAPISRTVETCRPNFWCADARMDDALTVLCEAAGAPEDVSDLRSAGITFASLHATLTDEGRPALLAFLKGAGVSVLSRRQAIANALQRHARTGSFTSGGPTTSSSNEEVDPGPAPPGSVTVNIKCSGALGGDNCPLDGKLRSSRVHTTAATVGEFYNELQRSRGYAMGFDSVRVGIVGEMLDPGEAASRRVSDGMSLSIIGPNRGG